MNYKCNHGKNKQTNKKLRPHNAINQDVCEVYIYIKKNLQTKQKQRARTTITSTKITSAAKTHSRDCDGNNNVNNQLLKQKQS